MNDNLQYLRNPVIFKSTEIESDSCSDEAKRNNINQRYWTIGVSWGIMIYSLILETNNGFYPLCCLVFSQNYLSYQIFE